MRRRRRSLDLLLALVLVAVLGAAVFVRQGTASSNLRSPPSPRPVAVAFGSAYLRVLGGGLSAGALPDATARVRDIAAHAGAGAPWRFTGALALDAVRIRYVAHSRAAQVLLTGQDRVRSYPFDLGLNYGHGGWRVVYLVPPDVGTILAPGRQAPSTPAAVRRAAARFALAYADYRESATRLEPPGLPSIRGQIATGQDPLAGTQPTRIRASLRSLAFGPQEGDIVAVSAVLADSGTRPSFSFVLQRATGDWQAWDFPQAAG